MWQESPYLKALGGQEALRGLFVRWKGNFNYTEDHKMLGGPAPCYISQGELHTGSGTSLREKCVAGSKSRKVGPSEPSDMRHGVTHFGVHLAGF